MDALGAAVERCQDLVWALARRGFVIHEDDLTQYLHGIEDHDVAEHVVVRTLAQLIAPAERAKITDDAALEPRALEIARARLVAYATRSGRITSLATASAAAQRPEEVEDLDAMIVSGGRPSDAEVPHDAEQAAWLAAATEACRRAVARADDRTQTLIELRFQQGQSLEAVAAHFTCGQAAVAAHESRVRRQLSRALKHAQPEHPAGHATLDAILAGAAFTARPPAITRARIRRDTLRRTFQEEPPPFGRRLAWGLGAAAIAAVAWGLMFFGVLPHPDDDPAPPPAVEVTCAGGCAAGHPVTLSVRAPEDAARVAFFAAGEPPRPLLVTPSGGTLRLPLGARGHLVPVPYPAVWPEGGADAVIAVFTGGPVEAETLTAVAAGLATAPGVSTATVGAR